MGGAGRARPGAEGSAPSCSGPPVVCCGAAARPSLGFRVLGLGLGFRVSGFRAEGLGGFLA